MQKYDGNPLNWPMFIQSFKVQIHDTCKNDAERLHHLRNHLTTEIQQHLGQALLNPGLYQHSLMELQRKFGNPRRVSTACSSSLLKLQAFRDNDFKALKTFASTLHSVVATLRLGGYGLELHSNTTLAQLVAKLPPILRSKWADFSYLIRDRLPNIVDFDSWLDDVSMAEYFVRSDVTSTQEKQHDPAKKGDGDKKRKSSGGPGVYATQETSSSCPHCKGRHQFSSCFKFQKLPPEKRSEIVKQLNCCYRCLNSGHLSSGCERSEPCGVNDCKRLHHPLLHGAPRMYPPNPVSFPSTPPASTPPPTTPPATQTPFNGTIRTGPEAQVTLLPIFPVILQENGIIIHTYAMLDTGSEITMIAQDVAKQLKLQGPAQDARISTFHSQDPAIKVRRVSFKITSVDRANVFKIEGCYSVPTLNLTKRSVNYKKLVQDWPHLAGLSLPSSQAANVTVLIGSDHAEIHEIFETKADPDRKRAPRAIRTSLGWCVVGPVNPAATTFPPQCHSVSIQHEHNDKTLSDVVNRFLLFENYEANAAIKPAVGKEEQRANQILEQTTRFVGDRYEAGLLWRSDEPNLPDNSQAVLKRFFKLEKRLLSDPKLCERYVKAIGEYVELGHARKLTKEEIQSSPVGRTWFLPHHPAHNPNKPDKCRPVFDASAVHRGTSLNSSLLKGPDLLTNLIGVLLRFREHRVPLSADIVKMFHQVKVRAADGPAFRFYWRQPGSEEPPAVYQMKVQIFGSICSPAICAYVLRRAAEEGCPYGTVVTRQVQDHFYVDNWLTSFKSEEEATQCAELVSGVLQRGGFQLSQWGSSSKKVLRSLPGQSVSSLDLGLDKDLPVERTLGLTLDFNRDAFVIEVRIQPSGSTKREVLRATSSIYDPLGFLAPVLLRAKLILQAICRSSVGWDDPLDSALLADWVNWTTSMSSLRPLIIPRCYNVESASSLGIGLHIFADASELAFGAVGFLRFDRPDGVKTSFVLAKSRVAPLKYVSIPRLELCAALLAARLSKVIKSELRLKVDQITFWSDSTTVLRWINSLHCRFHVYVGNRVGELLELSEPSQWRYVPTDQNPADEISRGLPAAEFTAEHRFLTGPAFLSKHPEEWPVFPDVKSEAKEAADPEIKSTNWAGATQYKPDSVDALTKRTSRLGYIINTVARCKRYVNNLLRSRPKLTGLLSANELQSAKSELIRRAQLASYSEEVGDLKKKGAVKIGSHLIKLTPFLNENELLCVGGRVGKAPIPFGARHQIILPANARITELLVFDMHQKLAHSSPERILHEMRQLYWIPRGRITIRRILNKCFTCKRFNAKPMTPMMAALPSHRLQPFQPAFARTGVDFFGPIEVNIFRRKVKRWGCLFTCLSSRAVHLEMSYSLDTDSFLSCMSRFENRRGTPAAYYSDNGTNFIGAENELRACLERLDQENIHIQLSRRGVSWNFNPPAAPHFGGSWERMVQSAKRALTLILNEQTLTDEILVTALTKVESLLNGRPLTHVSVDPADPEPITPNHLLLGRPNPHIPPDILDSTELTTRKRWRVIQTIIDHFWKRWMREYVPCLTERRKWLKKERNLAVGDIVLVIDSNTPRGKWPIGRVLEIFPGPDGVVRSANIHLRSATRTTELHRPVAKLCLLETWAVEEDPSEEDASDEAGRRAGDVTETDKEEASIPPPSPEQTTETV